jgi:hypothetical protein
MVTQIVCNVATLIDKFRRQVMRKLIQNALVVLLVLITWCSSAMAATAEKDWYLALRLGYQPYTIDAEGTLAGRDFDVNASLSDIIDKTDTTLYGGELEYGRGKWFINLAGFYQKSEADKGDATLGATATFKETAFNPMVGYRVYERSLQGGRTLSADVMAGIYYVKVETDIDVYDSSLGNFSHSGDFDFTDPMIGARGYLGLTEKLGLVASGQIGGFGVGSELNYTTAANLIYNFNDWFALSGGYKYWYFKYEDSGAPLSLIKQTLHGPVIGVQFKY